MKYAAIAAVAALGAALSGCASIIEGTTQSVAVTSPPAAGAHCSLVNTEGTWYLDTPGNATVHKTKNDLVVTCTKDGFKEASVKITPHFNGATVGNVLAGGIIGIGIDAATGANYNYPENIVVPMASADAAATPAAAPPAPAAPVAKAAPATGANTSS